MRDFLPTICVVSILVSMFIFEKLKKENPDLSNVGNFFHRKGGSIQPIKMVLVHVAFCNLLTEMIDGIVGRSASQDLAWFLSFQYLIDGSHQSHCFAWPRQNTLFFMPVNKINIWASVGIHICMYSTCARWTEYQIRGRLCCTSYNVFNGFALLWVALEL